VTPDDASTAVPNARRTADDPPGRYVFGIVARATEAPAELYGLDDQPLTTIVEGDIAAVVQPFDVSRRLGTRADLLRHSAVVDAVAGQGPVVPVRFGSVMESDTDVVATLLAPQHDHFRDLLEDLAGKQQFNVRATYVEQMVLAEVVDDNAEIADLRARTRDLPEDAAYAQRVRLGELVSQALDAKRADEGEQLLARLVPHAVAHRVREGGGLEHLLDVALLVAEKDRARFEAAAEELAAELTPRVRVRLLGPLAPYDFVPEG